MKIKPDHLAALRAAVEPLDTPAARAAFLANPHRVNRPGVDLDMRYRWDLLWASKLKIGDGVGMSGLPLYEYMNDTHIDSALRSIVPNVTETQPT